MAFVAARSTPVAQPLHPQRHPAVASAAVEAARQSGGHLVQRLSSIGATLAIAQLARQRRRGAKVRLQNSQGSKAETLTAEMLRPHISFLQKQAPSLIRFLGEDSTLTLEFWDMLPRDTGSSYWVDEKKQISAVGHLNNMKQVGQVRGLEFHVRPTHFGTVVLCVANVDAGVVCGLGIGNSKPAKQAAAMQVCDRLAFISEYSKIAQELNQASEEDEFATKTSEVLDAMGEMIKDTSLTVLQPCGSSWKAFMAAEFRGQKIFGISRVCESREAAVSLACESFYFQFRAKLRIPKDEPHSPQEWKEAMEYEKCRQELLLGRLGIEETQEELLDALRGGESEEKIQEALEAAKGRQDTRISEAKEESDHADEVKTGVIARRCYEVVKPEDEDWRRDEIKGKLPAEQVREELSKALEYSQCVIVSGGTGSGKTTQMPQFILDDFKEWKIEGESAEEPVVLEVEGVVEVEFEDTWYPCTIEEVAEDKSTITAKYHEGGDVEGDIDVKTRVRNSRPRWAREVPRIVVTQPRRIAAVTLAQRVAWERYGEVGGEIGHAIRGDSVFPDSETGTVEFCTVGTLLKRLMSDPWLSRFNVVVLDEIHERDLMTDYLLVLMKEVIVKRPDLRLVLMSATLDVATFVNYLPGAKVIEVPTGTRYPVEEFHLDDPFFEQYKETRKMLNSEAEAREAAGGTVGVRRGSHEFSVDAGLEGAAATQKEVLESQVADLIEADEDVQAAWEEYCGEVLGGEVDPSKHSEDTLRSFLLRQDDEDAALEQPDEETEPPSAVLAEQIEQVVNYSDEVREAWLKYREERDGSDHPQEWESSELLAFLTSQGVRPWKVDLASWEVVSSASWWGTDSNNKDFVSLAEQVIHKVVPEMLEVPSDDEFGTGSVLCFLPGWAEIKALANALEKCPSANDLWVLKLHSSVSKEDQQLVFETAPEGKVKVILATNIAESSVTINDVRVVVDAGLHREVTYDPKRRLSTMDTVWICQSNAVQRKGRAGRVREGRVFRLYSRDQFESVPWRPAPEIQRCNLANTCLSTIALGRDPREFLAKAPDPPMVANLEAAMAELSSIEAIQDGVPPKMLPMGQLLSRIPLEPLMGRAMILGTLFGIPQMTAGAITTASGGSPFIETPERRDEAMQTRREYCSWSDPVASLRALEEFEHTYKERGEFAARQWAEYFGMNYVRLSNMSRIKFQLMQDVRRAGLLNASDTEGLDPEEWMYAGADGEEGQAFWEDASDGAIMEAGETTRGLDMRSWLEELKSSSREVEDERLIVGILTQAFPTNVAVRQRREHAVHVTGDGSKAVIARMSVNSNLKRKNDQADDDNNPSWLPDRSWWLYGQLKLFNGQLAMQDTTYVSSWNLALFGGLTEQDQEDGSLELNGWIGVRGETDDTNELVRRLRKEIRQALTWVAIAASWDRMATSATIRYKAMLKALGRVLMGGRPEEEDLEMLRSWRLPEESETTLEADQEESRDEVEARLRMKTVAELKVLLREMGAKVSGRKLDLVQRCADFLMYGEEQAEGGWEEGGWQE